MVVLKETNFSRIGRNCRSPFERTMRWPSAGLFPSRWVQEYPLPRQNIAENDYTPLFTDLLVSKRKDHQYKLDHLPHSGGSWLCHIRLASPKL